MYMHPPLCKLYSMFRCYLCYLPYRRGLHKHWLLWSLYFRLLNYIYLHLSEVQYLLCLHVMLCQCCARNPSLSSLNEAVEIRVESQAEIEESSARIVRFKYIFHDLPTFFTMLYSMRRFIKQQMSWILTIHHNMLCYPLDNFPGLVPIHG